MTCLLELPHEVLQGILKEMEPNDLASASRTCHSLNSFIKTNRSLHKDVYLRCWDDPEATEPRDGFDWEDELHKLMKFAKLMKLNDSEAKQAELEFLSTTTLKLVQSSHRDSENSLNMAILTDVFESCQNMEEIMCGSTLFSTATGVYPPKTRSLATAAGRAAQQSAKLHCLHGIAIQQIADVDWEDEVKSDENEDVVEDEDEEKEPPEPTFLHPYARSRVYDLRRYTEKTMWGPFRDDGSGYVDWERVEAIMIILDHNFSMHQEQTEYTVEPSWTHPFHGTTPNSFKPMNLSWLIEPRTELEDLDPYNVTGTWLRIVCFLDYSELFKFNFIDSTRDDADRPPLYAGEATRLIVMKLRVTEIEAPGAEDGKALPVVHFKGTSRAMDAMWDENANSAIRVVKGLVRLTKEGEVRWTTWSIIDNEERWRSEGVQIGGPNSGRGVMGNWFDKDYDPRGPAGPNCFWKIHNSYGEQKRSRPSPTFQ